MTRPLRIILPIAAGAIVLAVAAARSRRDIRSVEADAARAQAARLESAARELAAARVRRDRLAAEAERLEKAGRSLRERLMEAESTPPAPEGASKGDAMETMIRNMTALQHEETLRTLTARLTLSPAQADRLNALLEADLRKALESLRENVWQVGPPDAEAPWKSAFRRHLTTEQTAAYDAYVAEEKARMEAIRVDMHAADLDSALDLRPDQTEAVKALLRKDPALSRTLNAYEELHPKTPLEELRSRQEAAAERLKQDLVPLLDPAQAAALDTYLQDRAAQRLEMLELVRAFYGPSEK